MTRNVTINELSDVPMDRRPAEICEHKGVGHPDTLIDGICEAASRDLSRAYIETRGRTLHHNLDKGLLISGTSAPRFGGGTLTSPIRAIICGKATSTDQVEPGRIAVESARRFLADHIRCSNDCFRLFGEIKEGSGDLTSLFDRKHDVPLANDTSFGVGYAPYSRLEKSVLDLAKCLRSDGFRQSIPAAGDDYKVMGFRVGESLRFVVALAFIDRYIENVSHYFATKQGACDYLQAHLDVKGDIRINTSDDLAAKTESGLYLTVTGLSAEMGDDGQVGRGNRVNGLITPDRVMSLEAAAGKNPSSHVGKIYNVLALLMAREIVANVDGVTEAKVQLLSAIGQPIDKPEVVSIDVRSEPGIDARTRHEIAFIADHWLSRTSNVTALILDSQGAPCCQFIDQEFALQGVSQ